MKQAFPAAFLPPLKKKSYQTMMCFGFDFTQRAPNAVELFADGPHHALENIETGNVSLEKESSYNITLGYNYDKDLNNLKIEAYYNYIQDFVAADRDGSTKWREKILM